MTKKRNHSMVINCGVQGCCPTVYIKEEKVELKDDYGNTAKMTKEQWIALARQTLKNI